MCVGPRRSVRPAAVLVLSALVVGAFGCGGGPSRQEEAASPPPAPKVLTAAERAAWYQQCWAHFNARAWDQFGACYADAAESAEVDSGQPAARGPEAVVANAKAITGAFPDMKGAGELVLVKGDAIVSVHAVSGMHTGTLARPGSNPIAATNRPVGYLLGHVVQTDATGSRVIREEFYADRATMLAQLGVIQAPARPAATVAAAAPTVVVSAGTPAELSNVELMRAQMAAYNTHDVKSVDAYYAPDLVYHDATAPRDLTFAENSSATQEFLEAFPDAKLTPLTAWGAGSYVVVTGRFEGTNRGPLPAMGIRRPTGKAVSARYLDIARWENGKIKEEWLFYDGMAMAGQLGLIRK